MADPLTDGPEDEKEIVKSENEARKDLERAQKKEKKGGSGRRRGYPPRFRPYADPPPESGRRERYYQPPAMVPQRPSRPRVLGPCWRCGAYGHIQAHCPMPQGRLYPLLQPVVSTSAEVDKLLINEVSACVGTSNVF